MKAPVTREELDARAEELRECPDVNNVHMVVFCGNASIHGDTANGGMLVVTENMEIITVGPQEA